jgi:ParB-like chromosome segregation protein Spo0J
MDTTNSRDRETQSHPSVRLGWRDFYKVHPAADAFPLLSPDELQKLARDIDKNGLKIPIQTRAVAGEAGVYVIDGRNRLDAMQSLGWQIVNEQGEWIGVLGTAPGIVGRVEHRVGYTHEKIAAEVIAFNIHRRHLSKEEQVELLDKALRAANPTDNAIMALSVKRGEHGRLIGSTKGHTGRVIEAAKVIGVSERTVKRGLAKRSPKPLRTKPQIDRTQAEYVVKKFQQFLNRWPVTQQRVVKGILLAFLQNQPRRLTE